MRRCPNCQSMYSDEVKFCKKDGTMLQEVSICPVCRTVYPMQIKFCKKDGSPLGQDDPSMQMRQQVPPLKARQLISPAKKGTSKQSKNLLPLWVGLGCVAAAVLCLIVLAYIGVIPIGDFADKNQDKVQTRETDGSERDKGDSAADQNPAFKVSDVANEDAVSDGPAQTAAEPGDAAAAGQESNSIDERAWRDAYSRYLEDINLEEYSEFGFMYVNDDDIPEIWCGGMGEAIGDLYLTYGADGIDELQSSRKTFHFLERQNLLDNSGGHMGGYFDLIYRINNGKWESVGKGYANEYFPEDASYAPSPDIHFTYTWNDIDVKWEDYAKLRKEAYDESDAVYLDQELTQKEILQRLDDGTISSQVCPVHRDTEEGIHTYEIIVADVSWGQAYSDCESRGGHLVHINSEAEYQAILDQIRREGQQDKIFYLGGTRDYGEQTYRWVSGGFTGKETLTENAKYTSYWMQGEPSCYGEDTDGNVVEEYCMDMFYYKSENRFVWNDVPDDILSAASAYRGRIAYICEYE